MLKRFYNNLNILFSKKKVLIIYGARQVGKTTLLERFLTKTDYKYKLDNGDNIRIKELFNSNDFHRIHNYISGYDIVAIDEAQEISNIGKALKIMIDQAPNLNIIATGSSSFDLSQKIGEPLTGRKTTIILYPIAQAELLDKYNKYELQERLEDFLIFGSYPEVLTRKTKIEKVKILREIADSYLLKDILKFDRIKSPKILLNLIKLLAFQIGSEVSLNEISSKIQIDVKTVQRYIDLLEKTFVIKKLSGFSKNLRKEVTSKCKYYFYDTGIRNAIISQFNSFEDRNDKGQLFENFVIMERMKKNAFNGFYGSSYFWRTYDGQEIDLIEEIDNILSAYEIKFNEKKKIMVPKDWSKHYKNSSFSVINSKNYLDYILLKD